MRLYWWMQMILTSSLWVERFQGHRHGDLVNGSTMTLYFIGEIRL